MASPKFVARCEACGEYQFDRSKVVAYRLRVIGTPFPTLESVDLGDRDPWSGIRIICGSCLVFFRSLPE